MLLSDYPVFTHEPIKIYQLHFTDVVFFKIYIDIKRERERRISPFAMKCQNFKRAEYQTHTYTSLSSSNTLFSMKQKSRYGR